MPPESITPTTPAATPPSSPTSNNPFAKRETGATAQPTPQGGLEQSTPQGGTEQGQQQPQGQPAQAQPQGQPAQQPAAQPAAQPNQYVMTDAQLAALGQQLRGPAQEQQQQPTQQPQISQEEFNKRFNVVTVDDQTYQAILGVAPDSPERVRALQNTLQGVVRQSLTMARFLVQQEVEKLQSQMGSQFKPLLEAHEQQRETAYKNEFFQKNPDLKNHEPLLVEIIAAAKARGLQFESPAQVMEYVSATANRILGRNGSAQNGQQRPTNAPAAPSMPTVSTGGRASNSAAAPTTQAQKIFGNRR